MYNNQGQTQMKIKKTSNSVLIELKENFNMDINQAMYAIKGWRMLQKNNEGLCSPEIDAAWSELKSMRKKKKKKKKHNKKKSRG